MTTLLAFHNDPSVKATYVARLEAHKAADEIIQGTYWQNGKGCAVGCSVHSDNHRDYETQLGIPAEIAALEDVIFEQFSNGDAKDFPLNFLNAIPVGADLSKVLYQFILWLLEDKEYGFMAFNIFTEEPAFAGAISALRDIYHRRLAGETITQEQYDAARVVVNRALDLDLALALALDLDLALALDLARARALDLDLARARARALDIARALARALALDLALARALARALALDLAPARALDLALARARSEVAGAWAAKLLELLASAPVMETSK